MKKRRSWLLIVSSICIGLSALIYAANYLIFRKPGEMFFLMMNDFASCSLTSSS